MSNVTLLSRVYVVIFGVEALLLLAFATLPTNLQLLVDQSPWTFVLLDTVSLTLISVPLVYLWAIRPFVSAQSEAEVAQLAKIANELTQFVDTANAPIFGIDTERRVNEWNQRSEQITGFTKAEVMGRDLVANFITDDYKVSVGAVLAKALHGEETANYEFPLFTQSGLHVASAPPPRDLRVPPAFSRVPSI